jgi:hypothetical protein
MLRLLFNMQFLKVAIAETIKKVKQKNGKTNNTAQNKRKS